VASVSRRIAAHREHRTPSSIYCTQFCIKTIYAKFRRVSQQYEFRRNPPSYENSERIYRENVRQPNFGLGITEGLPEHSTVSPDTEHVGQTADAPNIVQRLEKKLWHVPYVCSKSCDNTRSVFMDRLATALTNVIRSSPSSEMISGSAYDQVAFISVQ
jgi:hypothetical protein